MGAEPPLGPQIFHSIWILPPHPCNSHPYSDMGYFTLFFSPDRDSFLREVRYSTWAQSCLEKVVRCGSRSDQSGEPGPFPRWTPPPPHRSGRTLLHPLDEENTSHTALEWSAHGMAFPPSLWTTWELCPHLIYLGTPCAKHTLELHNVQQVTQCSRFSFPNSVSLHSLSAPAYSLCAII